MQFFSLGAPSLKKVVIVPTREETRLKNIAEIGKSCLLTEFLECEKNADGTIEEMVFEQLSFSHPISINFTSGTTGVPKGVVHCAGTFLASMRDFGLHCNLDRNDVVLSVIPVGWVVWWEFVNQFSLGLTLLLYDGNPIFLSSPSMKFWDLIGKYKVSYILFETSEVDQMEKRNIIPTESCCLENLRMVNICASPVKLQNIEFFHHKIKSDLFVGCFYGATESVGMVSGYDVNLPLYSAEIQTAALGVDIKCLNDNGKHVIGQIGDLVIASPTFSLPISVWNDSKSRSLQDLYFTKHKSVFNLNDRAWIDPETKGFLVIGRSDGVINQKGERFTSQDIYACIHDLDELSDYLCVSQESDKGDQRAVLFVKLKKTNMAASEIFEKIRKKIQNNISILHVPEVIVAVSDIPYNFNGKKLENLVKIIISTNKVPSQANVRNPECLDEFCNIPEVLNY